MCNNHYLYHMRAVILASFLFLATASIAGAQTSQKPDRATLLWLQVLRDHPELAPAGSMVGSTAIQVRYDELLRQRLGLPDKTSTVETPSAGAIIAPVADSAGMMMGDLPSILGDKATKATDTPREPVIKNDKIVARPGQLTPYQMCVKDGGCDGLK